MARDGHLLSTYMALFFQSDHPIGLKFRQHQYVTIHLKYNDQDLNMNWSMMVTLPYGPMKI